MELHYLFKESTKKLQLIKKKKKTARTVWNLLCPSQSQVWSQASVKDYVCPSWRPRRWREFLGVRFARQDGKKQPKERV